LLAIGAVDQQIGEADPAVVHQRLPGRRGFRGIQAIVPEHRGQAAAFSVQALDQLPAGSRVVNGYERSANLPLMGAGLNNRIIDVLEARRQFGQAGGGWRFDAATVRTLHATHFYVREGEKIDSDGCVTLREIDALRANPYNGKPYAQGRVLYAIDVCEAAR